MKNIMRIIVSLMLGLLIVQIGNAAESDYGTVRAWCNNEPATVHDLKAKIGEPINVKIEISSKINGLIIFELNEPGVTKSYDVISGPNNFNEGTFEYNITPGWSKEYSWTISPNGKWTDGNAPINIFVQFHKDINDDETVEFTIANPYILDQQYSGPTPTHTADPSSTDHTPSQGSPGFGVVGALVGIAFVAIALRD